MKQIALSFLILTVLIIAESCSTSNDSEKYEATIDSLENEVLKYQAIADSAASMAFAEAIKAKEQEKIAQERANAFFKMADSAAVRARDKGNNLKSELERVQKYAEKQTLIAQEKAREAFFHAERVKVLEDSIITMRNEALEASKAAQKAYEVAKRKVDSLRSLNSKN